MLALLFLCCCRVQRQQKHEQCGYSAHTMSSIFARRMRALCAELCVRHFRQDYNTVFISFSSPVVISVLVMLTKIPQIFVIFVIVIFVVEEKTLRVVRRPARARF